MRRKEGTLRRQKVELEEGRGKRDCIGSSRACFFFFFFFNYFYQFLHFAPSFLKFSITLYSFPSPYNFEFVTRCSVITDGFYFFSFLFYLRSGAKIEISNSNH